MSSAVKMKAQQADQMIRDLASAQQPAEAGDNESGANEPEAFETQQPSDDGNDPAAGESAPDGGDDSRLAELEREVDKANQRWRTLQGQLNSKDQQIETLHRLLANMETGQQSAPADQPEPKNQPVGHTKEDTDAFGEDMIDLIVRVSRQESANAVADLKRTMDGLSGKVETVEKTSSKVVAASFESSLDEVAPGWRELNEDPGFIEWLQESESRLHMFSEGAKARDASSVADIFNMYTQLHGGGQRRSRKQEVSQQVSPGRGRSSGAPTAQSQPDTKTWTRSEISQAYQRKQRGEIAADEFAKMEKQIAKAMSSGRVDYTR